MPAAGGAIASCTKALEVRNDKCFRRVTEAVHERSPTMDEKKHSVFLGEGYTRSPRYTSLVPPSNVIFC